MGFEAQPAETTYADFERDFARMGPAILHIPTKHQPWFLAIAREVASSPVSA